MKKAIIVIMIVLLVSLAALTFAGCSPAGEYKFESAKVTTGGVSAEYTVGDKILNVTIEADVMTLKINRDGTYVFTSKFPGFTVSESGNWTKDGDKIYFDDTLTATKKGKTLTVEYSGMTIVMKK